MRFGIHTLFDVNATFHSGQPIQFLWNESKPHIWWTLFKKNLIEVRQDDAGIDVSGVGDTKEIGDFVYKTFRLEDNLITIYHQIGTDTHIREIISMYPGLRLCHTDLWETLVCMIISQNNNLTRIKQNVETITELGPRVEIGLGTRIDHTFPSPKRLVEMSLKECGLGYRCDYLSKTAKLVSEGYLEGIEKLSTEKAREKLMKLPGVGRKVADTVLLFGLGRTEVFPVDTWILKVMKKLYKVEKMDKIQEFASKKWGKYAGYAQQYLFYWALNQLKLRKRVVSKVGKKKKKRK
jgi:N-glycosylase/DNA lyase